MAHEVADIWSDWIAVTKTTYLVPVEDFDPAVRP